MSASGVSTGGTCVCGVVGGVLVLVEDVLDLSLDLVHCSSHVVLLCVVVVGYLGGVLGR